MKKKILLKYRKKKLTFQRATYKRISAITGTTGTYRVMVDHLTFGIYTTCTRARIYAFLRLASFILGTFGIYHTFRTTSGGRSHKSCIARTYCISINCFTLTVWSAGGWIARIGWRCFSSYDKCNIISLFSVLDINYLTVLSTAYFCGITIIARYTATGWCMIEN